MKRWFEIWPHRCEEEIAAFQSYGIPCQRDEAEFANGRFVLVVTVTLPDGTAEPMRVVYPDTYPETRFQVFAEGALRLDRHQNPFEGNLCLLPQGGDFWTNNLYAADLIVDQVGTLLSATERGPEAVREIEFAQGEPSSTYLPYLGTGGVLLPEGSVPAPSGVSGRFSLVPRDRVEWLLHGLTGGRPQIGSALLASWETGGLTTQADGRIRAIFHGQYSIPGRWVRTDEPSKFRTIEAFRSKLLSELSKVNPTEINRWKLSAVAAVFPEEVRQGEYEDSWVFLVSRTKKGQTDAQFVRALRFAQADRTARVREIKSLSTKTVAVVGVGALGSAVAVELARAGAARVMMVDHDTVDPAAGARWATQTSGAGAAKTLALATRLGEEYPYTDFEALDLTVGYAGRNPLPSGRTEIDVLANIFARADLVFDCAAERDVSRALMRFAIETAKPQIVVFGVDGFGGVVARLVPGRTGCFHCFSVAVDDGSVGYPQAADVGVRDPIQPRGCAAPTFVSTAPEMAPLVSQALLMAFAELSERDFPPIPRDVHVFQLRRPDGSFMDTPTWSGYALPRRPGCPVCSAGSA